MMTIFWLDYPKLATLTDAKAIHSFTKLIFAYKKLFCQNPTQFMLAPLSEIV